jgi:hypothetical protein
MLWFVAVDVHGPLARLLAKFENEAKKDRLCRDKPSHRDHSDQKDQIVDFGGER